MERYLAALQENVCSICTDSSDIGICKLSEQEICAVENFLPEIVETVILSEDFDECVETLRKKICRYCRMDNVSGYCYLREDANCALDRYFPLIVETIQKVDKNV